MQREDLNKIFRDHGFDDFKWIDPEDIEVSQWVRIKCEYGCPDYGERSTCPPFTPSVDECREFFEEYQEAALLHAQKKLDNPEKKGEWYEEVNLRLWEIEREVFLKDCPKAFMLMIGDCQFCDSCERSRVECKAKEKARPSPEGMGVDIFKTVRKYDYPIRILESYDERMNRYAILMVE